MINGKNSPYDPPEAKALVHEDTVSHESRLMHGVIAFTILYVGLMTIYMPFSSLSFTETLYTNPLTPALFIGYFALALVKFKKYIDFSSIYIRIFVVAVFVVGIVCTGYLSYKLLVSIKEYKTKSDSHIPGSDNYIPGKIG